MPRMDDPEANMMLLPKQNLCRSFFPSWQSICFQKHTQKSVSTHKSININATIWAATTNHSGKAKIQERKESPTNWTKGLDVQVSVEIWPKKIEKQNVRNNRPMVTEKTWKKQEETQKIFLSKSITIDCVNFNWRCNWDAWSSHAQTSAACLQKLCPFDRILTATVSSRGHTRALGTHGHKCHTLQAFRGDLTLCLWATKCLRVFAAIHELRRWSFQQKKLPKLSAQEICMLENHITWKAVAPYCFKLLPPCSLFLCHFAFLKQQNGT